MLVLVPGEAEGLEHLVDDFVYHRVSIGDEQPSAGVDFVGFQGVHCRLDQEIPRQDELVEVLHGCFEDESEAMMLGCLIIVVSTEDSKVFHQDLVHEEVEFAEDLDLILVEEIEDCRDDSVTERREEVDYHLAFTLKQLEQGLALDAGYEDSNQ